MPVKASLGLVERMKINGPRILIVKNVEKFSVDEWTKLELASHPGHSVVAKWAKPKYMVMEPDYIDLGIGSEEEAIYVKYDGS